MSEQLATARVDLVADASGVEAGVKDATRSMESLGPAAQKAGKSVTDALKGTGEASASNADKIDRATQRTIASIERQALAVGKSKSEYYAAKAAIDGNADALKPYIQKLADAERAAKAQRMAQDAANDALGNAQKNYRGLGITIGQYNAAMRMVPAQFTDIAVGLASGQRPITVLLQQGGQLKDMFGSAAGAVQGLGRYVLGLINPYTLAAAAVVGLGYAFYKAGDELDAFNKQIALSGDRLGVTANQYNELAYTMAGASKSITQGAAADALVRMADAGKATAASLGIAAKAALDLARAGGPAVEKTAEQFAALADDPVKASAKLNESTNYLTESVFRQIVALQEQGRHTEAAKVAQIAYANAIEQQAGNIDGHLSGWAKAWREIVDLTKKAGDGVVGMFRDKPPVEAARDDLKLAQMKLVRGYAMPADVQAAQARYDKAVQIAAAEKKAADAVALQAEKTRYLVDLQQKEFDQLDKKDKKRLALQGLDKEASRLGLSGDEKGRARRVIEDTYKDDKQQPKTPFDVREIAKASEALAVARVEATRAADGVSLLTNAEKEYAKVAASPDFAKLTEAKKDAIKAAWDAAAAQERLNAAEEASRKGRADEQAQQQALTRSDDAALQAARDAVTAAREQYETYGYTKSALLELSAAKEEALIRDQYAGNVDDETLAKKKAIVAAMREQAAVLRQGEQRDAATGNAQEIANEWKTASADIGRSLSDAFEGAGKSLAKLVTGLGSYKSAMQQIAIQQAKDSKAAGGDPAKLQAANVNAARSAANAQISLYADMADAAKGFFNENSKGYKVLEAAEKAFRLVQIAGEAQALAAKLASIGPSVAASTAKGTADAAAAVANQAAGGDPYSAWPRMALMAAAMAALGFAVAGGSGSGSVDIAKQRQDAAGTGSVLGDATAKSDSIAKSLEEIDKLSSLGVTIQSAMLTSLHNIEAGLVGLGKLTVQNDVAGGAAQSVAGQVGFETSGFGKALQFLNNPFGALNNIPIVGTLTNLVGNLIGGLFGTKKSLTDEGIVGGPQTIASILQNGFQANAYADIESKKKFLGFTTSTSTSETLSPLSAEIKDQFGKVIAGLVDGVRSAASVLGVSGDDFTKRLQNFVVDIGHISLKGLNGEQITAQFNTIFGKVGDDLAKTVFPDLVPFQKVGEGIFQTLSRVATEMQGTDVLLGRMGKTSQEAFGAVGIASLAARENLLDLAGGLDKMAELLSDYQKNFYTDAERNAITAKEMSASLAAFGLTLPATRDDYRKLVDAQDLSTESGRRAYLALLQMSGAFYDITQAAEDAAKATKESADELVQATQDIRDSLLSKYAPTLTPESAYSKVSDGLGSLGFKLGPLDSLLAAGPDKLRASVYELAQSIDKATPAGQALAKVLDTLGPAIDAIISASQSAKDDATAKAQKAATDGLNSTFDSLKDAFASAQQALTDEYNKNVDSTKASITSLTATVSKLQSLSSALHNALKATDVTADPAAQWANARAQITATLAIAKAGGVLPDASTLEDALSVLSKPNADLYASATDYARDAAQTANDLNDLAGITDKQLTDAQKSLDVANKTLDQLKQVYDAQTAGLKAQLDLAQQQLDAINGVVKAVMDLSTAQQSFSDVKQTYGAQQIVGRLGDTPDESQIVAAFTQANIAGISLDALVKAWNVAHPTVPVKTADMQAWARAHGIKGYATGGDFGGGLRLVGENGPEIEATGPSRIFSNAALRRALRGGDGDNAALLAETRALRQEVAALREANSAENLAIARNTRTSAKALSGSGDGDALKVRTIA